MKTESLTRTLLLTSYPDLNRISVYCTSNDVRHVYETGTTPEEHEREYQIIKNGILKKFKEIVMDYEIQWAGTPDNQQLNILDPQVVTAKNFPRDIVRSRENSIAIATMSKEMAETCGYALPRGNKPIQGPSVHLARVLAQNWGNIRVESRVIETTDKEIVSQAICHDLETNFAAKIEVRKSIVGSRGRYNNDMITVTGNAANAIAFRNAVFAVIPKGVVNAVYQATRNLLTGELNTEEKLIKARTDAVNYFKESYGVTDAEIFKAFGVKTINGIKQEQIVLMRSTVQAIKDGDTTPDEVFRGDKATSKDVEKMKSKMRAKAAGKSKIQMP